MSMKLVDKQTLIDSRKPYDVLLTLGKGILGIGEDWQRKKDGEDVLATHAAMCLGGDKMIESSGRGVSDDNKVSSYLGGRRKTWFWRYGPITAKHTERIGLLTWAAKQLDVPYGHGDIINHIKEFFGAKRVYDSSGVVCSGLVSILIAGAQLTYMPIPGKHMDEFDRITPSDILNWMYDFGENCGWGLTAYAERERFFINEP